MGWKPLDFGECDMMKPEMKMFLIFMTLVIVLSPLYSHSIQCFFVTQVVARSLMVFIFWIPFLLVSFFVTLFISNIEIKGLVKLWFKFTFYWSAFLVVISLLSTMDNTTPKLNELLTDVQKQIYSYQVNNKTYPKTYEALLEKAGCKMKDNECTYKRERLNIHIKENESTIFIDITKRDKKLDISIATCSVAMKKTDNKIQEVHCSERSCIQLSH